MRRPLVFWMTLLGLLLIAPGASAQSEEHGDDRNNLVVLTGGAAVTEDQQFRNVVVFRGDVDMAGEVHEDVVVFHGNTTISGLVGGDVVVFEGNVTIASGAEVLGDVASFREPVIEDGARVAGDVRRPNRDFFRPLEAFAARAAFWIASTVSLLILGLLLLWLAPRAMDAVARTWATSKGSSALWGVLLLIGLPVASILVMLTLVGIPFGLGTLLALFFIYSLGYVFGAWAVGRSVMKESSSRALTFLAGFGIVRLLGLIPIAGGIVSFVVTVFGLGLAAVTLWRARSEPAAAATA